MILPLLALALAGPPRDSVRAELLYREAVDLLARLDRAGAMAKLKAAYQTDPAHLTAYSTWLRYLTDAEDRGVLRLLARTRAPAGLGSCALVAQQVVWQLRPRRDLLRLTQYDSTRLCAAYFLGLYSAPDSLTETQRRAALRAAPGDGHLPYTWALYYQSRGRPREARQLLQHALPLVQDPLDRIQLLVLEIRLLDRSDPGLARSQYRALAAAVARESRLGIRLWLALASESIATSATQRDSLRQWRLHWAQAAGSASDIAQAYLSIGSVALDSGNPRAALSAADSALYYAQQSGINRRITRSLLLRGRIASKVGRWRAAERDLAAAMKQAAGAGSSYDEVDALHNLAHVFEGQADWNRAVDFADRFVTAAQQLQGDGLAIISLRDAGIIKWRAGQLAAANRLFAQMVARIDQQRSHYVWAGEHFERNAQLNKARQYYQRARSEGGDSARALAGLARTYFMLGDRDSARLAAAQHDRVTQTPEEVPLLPLVLARDSLHAAIRIAWRWAERQERLGNSAGATRAFLQTAELMLQARDLVRVETMAARAYHWATRIHDPDLAASAQVYRARALIGLGRVSEGTALLARLRSKLALLPPATRVTTLQTLGDAHALSGRRGASLAAYQEAATASEAAGSPLDIDFERIRFADANLSPYDRALELLLSDPAPRPEAVLAWSTRKKDASTARKSKGAGDPRRALLEGHAFVDYVIVDGHIAATIVTRSQVETVLLRDAARLVQPLIERLRRPFEQSYFGRVDLARLQFDSAAAKALHRILLQPLHSSLRKAQHLTISPDGVLGLLPFDALLAPNGFIIEQHSVAYTPSASWLGDREVTVDLARTRLGTIGGQAPGAARELATLRAMLPATLSLPGTEAALRTNERPLGVLHIAAHAQASPLGPLHSHVTLQAGGGHDGLLHAAEIALLRPAATLTVLTGCETAAGRVYASAGVAGLARAFLLAGSRAVIATQWPVTASAADFSSTFYHELASTSDVREALWKTKLALLNDPRASNPFFWAGYTLLKGSRQAEGRGPDASGPRPSKS